MNANSTHDTKRSEDVRQRINVLSEMPQQWEKCLTRWRNFNQKHLLQVDQKPAPDPNEELLLYQTLVGAWPFEDLEKQGLKGRIKNFMIKAGREAKIHTHWVAPTRM
jgi:(1->4)-alpha-D-glucan 1-alpha-D-glucosylmutase